MKIVREILRIIFLLFVCPTFIFDLFDFDAYLNNILNEFIKDTPRRN